MPQRRREEQAEQAVQVERAVQVARAVLAAWAARADQLLARLAMFTPIR
jgi:hypothetical protein